MVDNANDDNFADQEDNFRKVTMLNSLNTKQLQQLLMLQMNGSNESWKYDDLSE